MVHFLSTDISDTAKETRGGAALIHLFYKIVSAGFVGLSSTLHANRLNRHLTRKGLQTTQILIYAVRVLTNIPSMNGKNQSSCTRNESLAMIASVAHKVNCTVPKTSGTIACARDAEGKLNDLVIIGLLT